MSRKDTIIIAVLMNAALLIVLFATALTSHEDSVKTEPQVVLAPLQKEVKSIELERPALMLPSPPVIAKEEPKVREVSREVIREIKVAPEGIEISVKRGDTLDRIAKSNGVQVEEIMKHNGLTSTRLSIGQTLKIPKKSQPKKETPQEIMKTYTVKSGDTLWYIASKHHMQVEELLKLNRLDEESARRLKPGDTLYIK